jgi:hypothetical protein
MHPAAPSLEGDFARVTSGLITLTTTLEPAFGPAFSFGRTGDKKLSHEMISPNESQQRMSALGISQICLAALSNVSPTKINRFLRGQTQSLSASQNIEVRKVLEECEFLAAAFQPLHLNFRDPDRALANLQFLRQVKAEEETNSWRRIVERQFSALGTDAAA